MVDVMVKIAACIPCACLFFFATYKSLGVMQQSGYKNKAFLRWMRRKDNLYFNRLAVWGGLGFFACLILALSFSVLGVVWARVASSIPFFAFCILFLVADKKYALKVPVVGTGRIKRVAAVYVLFLACACFIVISLLDLLAFVIGSTLYDIFAFVPFTLITSLLPFILCAANGVESLYSNAHNKRFIEKARKVLKEKKDGGLLCVGIVGSYGKTSVKNILEKILSVKYSVCATPQSYNTPMGIAKTVVEGLDGKDVFLAEMGARKSGDIEELCLLVEPDYAVFTGVCPQHIASFGSEDEVLNTKSEVLKFCKSVVCANSLKEKFIGGGIDSANCEFVDFDGIVEGLTLRADGTAFTLNVGSEKITIETKLLGKHNAENIALAAALALKLGLTAEEIAKGVANVTYIPHRLELSEVNGVYVLDDGYNANERGAKEAIDALKRFSGKRVLVTPGIVEGGVLEEKINGELGEYIANAGLDKVILVGTTLVNAVKSGYVSAGGDTEKLAVCENLEKAKELFSGFLEKGDCILFLNDLPDVY